MSQYIAHVFLPMIAKGMSEMTQKAQFILKGLNIYCSLIILFDLWFGSTTNSYAFRSKDQTTLFQFIIFGLLHLIGLHC